MKTYSAKRGDIRKGWLLIDAAGVVLGRLAARVATLLQGKHKPTYEPHLDCGDNVVVVNADKVVLTGKKERDKIYYRHTGYPGGIRKSTVAVRRGRGQSDRVVRAAVEGMMPDGPRARRMLKGLYVYGGGWHMQEAQKPVPVDFAAQNRKNVRRGS